MTCASMIGHCHPWKLLSWQSSPGVIWSADGLRSPTHAMLECSPPPSDWGDIVHCLRFFLSRLADLCSGDSRISFPCAALIHEETPPREARLRTRLRTNTTSFTSPKTKASRCPFTTNPHKSPPSHSSPIIPSRSPKAKNTKSAQENNSMKTCG